MYSLLKVGNGSDDATEKQYFDLLSRGDLTVPSTQMIEVVYACFAALDFADEFMVKHNESTTRESVETILEKFSKICF